MTPYKKIFESSQSFKDGLMREIWEIEGEIDELEKDLAVAKKNGNASVVRQIENTIQDLQDEIDEIYEEME